MAQLAVAVGIAIATQAASSALAPKPRQQRVDKGRLDDLRIQTAEEGDFIPLVYGRRARLAGNIIWATRTKEFVTPTPGRSGGKNGGGGRAAEPPANNFTYKKSFCIRICGNEIKRVRRINEGLETIFQGDGSEPYDDYYEAELATLSGTAQAGTGTGYSGGRAVVTGIAGTVLFPEVRAFLPGVHLLTIFYKESSGTNVTLAVNASSQTVALAATGPAVGTAQVSVTLARGLNAVSLTTIGFGASTIIDRIHVENAGPVVRDPVPTLVVDGDGTFPSDPDDATPFYNYFPEVDADGYATGTLTGGGQAFFEIMTGTEDQPQSATVVAVEGAENTPAYRGDALFVAKDYLLKDGQLQTFTFEVEPAIQDLADIMTDLYLQDGRAAEDELDFSALAGVTSEGFVVDRRESLSAYINSLQLWYGFDVVPSGGKITAVMRGGATSHTVTADDLMAHYEGEERPAGYERTEYNDPLDVPGSVEVLYLNPSSAKDFHTGAEPAQVQVGASFDHDTLSFPVVGDPDAAASVGRRYLEEKELERTPVTLRLGPKFRHAIPTDLADVVLPGVTRNYRFVSVARDLRGLVTVKAVPERAAIYTDREQGSFVTGREVPAVEFPANTLCVVADCVALRQEDVNRLVVITAGCPRGRGRWPGYHLNKLDRNDEYERLAGTDRAATIGVVETPSQASTVYGFDRAREFVVKLHHGALESRSEAQVLAERVNTALYGKGDRWEVIQFTGLTAQAASAPYVAQYLVKGVLSGLLGTEQDATTHQANDFFVLFDEGCVSVPMRLDELTLEKTFVGQTVGQAVADAEVASSQTLTFNGNSMRALRAANFRSRKDSDGDTLAEFEARARFGTDVHGSRYPVSGEEQIKFELVPADASFAPLPDRPPVVITPGLVLPMALVDTSPSGHDKKSQNNLLGAEQAVAVSLQAMTQTGSFVEAGLESEGTVDGSGVAALGLLPAGLDWRTATLADTLFAVTLQAETFTEATLKIYVGGVLEHTVEGLPLSGDRYCILPNGIEVEVHRNYREGSQPLYASPVPPRFPLRGFVSTSWSSEDSGHAKVLGAVMRCAGELKAFYSAAQRERDYGSTSAAAYGRLYQINSVTGRGFHLEVSF